jgi:hypothetical protein
VADANAQGVPGVETRGAVGVGAWVPGGPTLMHEVPLRPGQDGNDTVQRRCIW